MLSKNLIEIKNISFSYGSLFKIENIQLAIKKGTFLAIIGPNGSGKTTLLKLLTKSIKPESGVVFLEDQNMNNIRQRDLAKKIAIVPQNSYSTFAFSSFEIVMMGRTPHLSRWQFENNDDFTIVKEAMEKTNTWHLKERPITELSGGEKQRVIVAQALAQQPKILLLDEPTLHLDLNHQIEIMNLLRQLHSDKITIVAVLHDLNLAANYADEVAVIKNGKILIVGKPEEILTGKLIKDCFDASVTVKKHFANDANRISIIPNF